MIFDICGILEHVYQTLSTNILYVYVHVPPIYPLYIIYIALLSPYNQRSPLIKTSPAKTLCVLCPVFRRIPGAFPGKTGHKADDLWKLIRLPKSKTVLIWWVSTLWHFRPEWNSARRQRRWRTTRSPDGWCWSFSEKTQFSGTIHNTDHHTNIWDSRVHLAKPGTS